MDNIKVLIEEQHIKTRLKEIAQKIDNDFGGEEIVLICILKGSVYIMCELSKYIKSPVYLDFMAVSSYGDDTKSSGRVRIIKDLDDTIKDKNVIIIEDIVDSGRTLTYLSELLLARKPRSLKICTLLDKPERREEEFNINVDYVGFTIPDKFVVGYGLDYAQRYRNLPYIGYIDN